MQIKILHIFFLILMFQSQAMKICAQTSADSGRVTLHMKNQPLRAALEEISHQSSSRFVFNDILVENKKISCSFENKTVENAIQQLFEPLDIGYRIFPCGTVALFKKIRITQQPKIKETKKIDYAPIEPPKLRIKIKPAYPLKAQKDGMEGRVNLDLLIDKNGKVKVAKIMRSAGEPLLDSAAVEYSKRLSFYPATKNGEATEVWLTWHVNYKSQQTSLLESRYIDRMQTLHRLSGEYSDTTRTKILKAILATHRIVIDYFMERPNLNYNELVKEVVLDEVYQKWKIYWNDWQLHFVVFQDYLLRYPNSKYTSLVITDLIHHFEQDLNYIKQNSTGDELLKSKIESLEDKLEIYMQAKNGTSEVEFIAIPKKEYEQPQEVNR